MKLTLILLLFAAEVSFAQMDVKSETRYQTLLSWHGQGHDVKWADIKGSYSGRCYWINKQNNPEPNILTYVLPTNNDGPGFPNFPLAFFMMGWSEPRPVQDYDNISLKDLTLMQDAMRSQFLKKFVDFTEVPTVTQLVDFEPNSRTDLNVEYRRFQNFITVRVTNLIAQNYANPESFFAKAGDIIETCYFFKQVGD